MISAIRMCEEVKRRLAREQVLRVWWRNQWRLERKKSAKLRARIHTLRIALGKANDAERARRAELRALRRAQLELPL